MRIVREELSLSSADDRDRFFGSYLQRLGPSRQISTLVPLTV